MPAGDFMDVRLGNSRRKALLQKLLAQYSQERGSRGAMGSFLRSPPVRALPLWGGMRRARAEGDLPAAPIPQLTVPFPIPPGLADKLGPGGAGIPGQGNFSQGPGIPAIGGPSAPYPGAGWGAPATTGSPAQSPTLLSAPTSSGGPTRRLYGAGTASPVGYSPAQLQALASFLRSQGLRIGGGL